MNPLSNQSITLPIAKNYEADKRCQKDILKNFNNKNTNTFCVNISDKYENALRSAGFEVKESGNYQGDSFYNIEWKNS